MIRPRLSHALIATVCTLFSFESPVAIELARTHTKAHQWDVRPIVCPRKRTLALLFFFGLIGVDRPICWSIARSALVQSTTGVNSLLTISS
jgi:hypothetical protein